MSTEATKTKSEQEQPLVTQGLPLPSLLHDALAEEIRRSDNALDKSLFNRNRVRLNVGCQHEDWLI